MLRECRRVLKQNGRIGGYVIHTPPDLTPAAAQWAAELGPTDVASPHSPAELLALAGMTVIEEDDVTDLFRATCENILKAQKELEDELRAEKGDEIYEEEVQEAHKMITGIDEGLLLRSLTVGTKP